ANPDPPMLGIDAPDACPREHGIGQRGQSNIEDDRLAWGQRHASAIKERAGAVRIVSPEKIFGISESGGEYAHPRVSRPGRACAAKSMPRAQPGGKTRSRGCRECSGVPSCPRAVARLVQPVPDFVCRLACVDPWERRVSDRSQV